MPFGGRALDAVLLTYTAAYRDFLIHERYLLPYSTLSSSSSNTVPSSFSVPYTVLRCPSGT